MSPSKECRQCGKQCIGKHQKVFCSQSCSATYSNKRRWKDLIETTNCNYCDIEYKYHIRRENGKYCSVKCQHRHNAKLRRERNYKLIESNQIDLAYKSESTQRRWVKKYLIDKYGEKCMVCGWNEVNVYTNIIPIQLDHIDGNPHNQSLDNCQLVCPNHHSLTEFYGSRGQGRKVELGGYKR